MSRSEVVPGRPNRTALAGLLSLLFILLGTGTAAADPAAPTNYESTVFDADPAVAGAAFTVVGGDAFMEVEVAERSLRSGPRVLQGALHPDRYRWVGVAEPRLSGLLHQPGSLRPDSGGRTDEDRGDRDYCNQDTGLSPGQSPQAIGYCRVRRVLVE